MIPHSGRVMRQCNRLSKSSMQFITGAIKNEKSCNISTSLNRQSDEKSNKNQQQQQQQQQHYEQQQHIQQEYICSYPQPNPYAQQYAQHFYPQQPYTQQQYMHPQQQIYPQYPQQLQYVQQPLPYPQLQYQPQQQQQVFYSSSASNHVNIKYNAAPASSSTTVVKPSPAEVQDEKLRLKLERQRLSEIRTENNARFKAYLASLPQLQYPSRYKVECINTLDEANQRLAQLIKQDKRKAFGVDLEWPPCFVKGQPENKVSLVQVCSFDKILLIQLSRIQGFPSELCRFFEDKKLLKSGVNIGADGLKLQRDFGIVTNGLVELRDLAELAKSPKLGISHLRSLRALTGIFLDQNMSKGKVRMSNWGRPDLTPIQIKYAALDAYASYQLFVTLDELRDVTKPMRIRHLIEEVIPATKEEKKAKKKLQQQQQNHAHNNRSSPTSTVTVIRKKQQQTNKNYNDKE